MVLLAIWNPVTEMSTIVIAILVVSSSQLHVLCFEKKMESCLVLKIWLSHSVLSFTHFLSL